MHGEILGGLVVAIVIVLGGAFLVGGQFETSVTASGEIVRTNRLSGQVVVCYAGTCTELPMPNSSAQASRREYTDAEVMAAPGH